VDVIHIVEQNLKEQNKAIKQKEVTNTKLKFVANVDVRLVNENKRS